MKGKVGGSNALGQGGKGVVVVKNCRCREAYLEPAFLQEPKGKELRRQARRGGGR